MVPSLRNALQTVREWQRRFSRLRPPQAGEPITENFPGLGQRGSVRVPAERRCLLSDLRVGLGRLRGSVGQSGCFGHQRPRTDFSQCRHRPHNFRRHHCAPERGAPAGGGGRRQRQERRVDLYLCAPKRQFLRCPEDRRSFAGGLHPGAPLTSQIHSFCQGPRLAPSDQ